ncbi:ECF transporter S component [Bhargavaea beijingensis]|uniref:Riboflavin transporter n=1 Tax=Bhargavaea beijingensis TaxID=426756 RepID=A0A1G7ANU5_9BACL|nr:ECF transporter S component [Bhargavaea beijingensis]MCW1928217.1 ECF transporter S component [Bhargavaea beijingensis]RSK37881.1 ECF transporter S component [Bhargavaea beijingensis]SDE16539.1 Riboflavin transporter FmnP [Bhargavaea beijingensis]
MKKKNTRLRSLIAIAMLSSISFVLMLFNFPLPPFPAFLQVDFSEVPAIIAAITMGPVAGILVELLKNVLDWLFSGSPTGVPVGHMANFATGVLFILPVWWVYHRLSNAKGMTTGLILGTMSMAVGMSLLNYVLFLPLYVKFMNFPVMSGEELYQMIVLGILPFNLLKGIILAGIVLLLFRSMRRWIEKQRAVFLG